MLYNKTRNYVKLNFSMKLKIYEKFFFKSPNGHICFQDFLKQLKAFQKRNLQLQRILEELKVFMKL